LTKIKIHDLLFYMMKFIKPYTALSGLLLSTAATWGVIPKNDVPYEWMLGASILTTAGQMAHNLMHGLWPETPDTPEGNLLLLEQAQSEQLTESLEQSQPRPDTSMDGAIAEQVFRGELGFMLKEEELNALPNGIQTFTVFHNQQHQRNYVQVPMPAYWNNCFLHAIRPALRAKGLAYSELHLRNQAIREIINSLSLDENLNNLMAPEVFQYLLDWASRVATEGLNGRTTLHTYIWLTTKTDPSTSSDLIKLLKGYHKLQGAEADESYAAIMNMLKDKSGIIGAYLMNYMSQQAPGTNAYPMIEYTAENGQIVGGTAAAIAYANGLSLEIYIRASNTLKLVATYTHPDHPDQEPVRILHTTADAINAPHARNHFDRLLPIVNREDEVASIMRNAFLREKAKQPKSMFVKLFNNYKNKPSSELKSMGRAYLNFITNTIDAFKIEPKDEDQFREYCFQAFFAALTHAVDLNNTEIPIETRIEMFKQFMHEHPMSESMKKAFKGMKKDAAAEWIHFLAYIFKINYALYKAREHVITTEESELKAGLIYDLIEYIDARNYTGDATAPQQVIFIDKDNNIIPLVTSPDVNAWQFSNVLPLSDPDLIHLCAANGIRITTSIAENKDQPYAHTYNLDFEYLKWKDGKIFEHHFKALGDHLPKLSKAIGQAKDAMQTTIFPKGLEGHVQWLQKRTRITHGLLDHLSTLDLQSDEILLMYGLIGGLVKGMLEAVNPFEKEDPFYRILTQREIKALKPKAEKDAKVLGLLLYNQIMEAHLTIAAGLQYAQNHLLSVLYSRSPFPDRAWGMVPKFNCDPYWVGFPSHLQFKVLAKPFMVKWNPLLKGNPEEWLKGTSVAPQNKATGSSKNKKKNQRKKQKKQNAKARAIASGTQGENEDTSHEIQEQLVPTLLVAEPEVEVIAIETKVEEPEGVSTESPSEGSEEEASEESIDPFEGMTIEEIHAFFQAMKMEALPQGEAHAPSIVLNEIHALLPGEVKALIQSLREKLKDDNLLEALEMIISGKKPHLEVTRDTFMKLYNSIKGALNPLLSDFKNSDGSDRYTQKAIVTFIEKFTNLANLVSGHAYHPIKGSAQGLPLDWVRHLIYAWIVCFGGNMETGHPLILQAQRRYEDAIEQRRTVEATPQAPKPEATPKKPNKKKNTKKKR
jgi:hypothetical protein